MREIPANIQEQIEEIRQKCSHVKPCVVIHSLAYNHGAYIRETLEGFVRQRTDFPVVAVVHDDASTDNTAVILREYAEKYPDIILPIFESENQYSNPEGWLGEVMRLAMEATGAPYIAICECDDYWTDPLKLQKQVDFLEANPECSMCCGGYVRREKGKADIPMVQNKNYSHDFFFTLQDWGRKWITMPLTIVYRRNCLAEYWQKYDLYKYTRDIHLIYHLLKAGKGVYLSELLAVYHVHEGGVASGVSKERGLANNYNCHRELYLNNKDDEVLRHRWFVNAVMCLIYPLQLSKRELLKDSWKAAVGISQKMILLCVYMIPSFVFRRLLLCRDMFRFV